MSPRTTTPPAPRTDTRSRIVDAATRLLAEDGVAGVTTRRVADSAGVQAPAIYRLFGDKDGLLDAVAEQVMATYVTTKAAVVETAAAQGADPVEDLSVGWENQIAFGLANPALFALLSDPGRGAHSPAVRAGQRVLAARVHRLAEAGRLRVEEQRAVDLVHAAGTGAVLTLLATPPEHRHPGLAQQLYDAVLARILTDAPEPGEDPTVTAAVAVRAAAPGLEVLTESERALLAEWLDRVIAPS